ncbi:Isopentenyl-diphosphate Delta-isomerase 1 [Nosema bombycis CQ1]|uniref:isopentenyl-diphosphate Delta-isomerase n=1 Tax=Nosema bombycis (strain CQ1 / CVCC 102059) TaxID=578461 RepID=R0KTQ6_NOSB1|nr:Isopentenyl-diphosphate Delta-isomerase 1 [Nosema bombycis CQ1]|eukprot:EOB14201.1 Isopentenyl-diphosphate Delta-isomerase 1 [Nosema bombycis CQ1]
MDNFYQKVICVDENDKIIGSALAGRAHSLRYLERHRGFSLFLFDINNRLLVQKRSKNKFVFPGLWSNTVCSHPFLNPLSFSDPLEDVKNHVIQRAKYELGINELKTEDLQFVTRLRYKAINEDVEGDILDGMPSSQNYFESECRKDDSINNQWGESEIDYIFVCKKEVNIKINSEEVEECAYISKIKFEQMLKNKKVSPWVASVCSFVDIFNICTKIENHPHGTKTTEKNCHREKANEVL